MAPALISESSYSQVLRVVGQILEQIKPLDFDLQILRDDVILRFRAIEKVVQERPKGKFGFFSAPSAPAKNKEIAAERRYSMQDIETLDREGQSQRVTPDGEAEFYLLSQTLRTVGTYVEHRNFRLLGLTWDGSRLVLQLEGADGRAMTEEHAVASFHDYFLRMYLKRKKSSPVSSS